LRLLSFRSSPHLGNCAGGQERNQGDSHRELEEDPTHNVGEEDNGEVAKLFLIEGAAIVSVEFPEKIIHQGPGRGLASGCDERGEERTATERYVMYSGGRYVRGAKRRAECF